jgi:ribosome-associated protein
MISVTRAVSIGEDEISIDYVRSGGPGGQNVNKVATAAQLRFDIANSPNLPDDVRKRLVKLGGSRVTSDGVLIIDARRYRTQEKNREDAVNRLIKLIRKAAQKPKPRRKTKPPRQSKEKRLESKRRRSATKEMRKPIKTNAHDS